jgi:hypothetical protein
MTVGLGLQPDRSRAQVEAGPQLDIGWLISVGVGVQLIWRWAHLSKIAVSSVGGGVHLSWKWDLDQLDVGFNSVGSRGQLS